MSQRFEVYEKLIDKILKYFAGPALHDELMMAKKEFFDGSGVVDEQAMNYEVRMSQFYDWYFFSRELKGYGHTPLESCHLVRELRFDETEQKCLLVLKQFRHSLFELSKIKGNDLYLKDLLRDEKLVVKDVENTFGFNTDEIFEVRLLSDQGNWQFTRGFCFHPPEAKKYIYAEVKKHRKNPDLEVQDLMLKLIKMKYKFEQYKHVSSDLIYADESVMRF